MTPQTDFFNTLYVWRMIIRGLAKVEMDRFGQAETVSYRELFPFGYPMTCLHHTAHHRPDEQVDNVSGLSPDPSTAAGKEQAPRYQVSWEHVYDAVVVNDPIGDQTSSDEWVHSWGRLGVAKMAAQEERAPA